MKNTKLLLGTTAAMLMLAGCPTTNPPADSGVDAFRVDTGPGTGDGGPDGGPIDVDMGGPGLDAGTPVTCDAYCALITTNCTATNVQYTDMTACMTACTAAGWTMGNNTDTAGNTLGCRVYHAGAASGGAALHCPHAGFYGGAGAAAPGPCSPFRADPPVEGHPTTADGAYVRVDRMGMPAVATALVGPGSTGDIGALKDGYNDSSPNADATFANATPMLTAMGAFHALLDADLVAGLHMTPCSMTHQFPAAGLPVATVPACAVQQYSGAPISSTSLAGTVASLIVPDTIVLNTAAASGFPNGRQPTDDVINPTLAVLLLNLSPCAGSPTGTNCTGLSMTACGTTTGCNYVAGACVPTATSRAAQCAALSGAACSTAVGCLNLGTSCVPVPCEAIGPTSAACGGQAGCSASTCGTGGATCNVHSLDNAGLTPHMGDHSLATFPYFAAPN